MTLVNNIQSLATRVGQEFKAVRTEQAAIADARYTKSETDAAISSAIDAVVNGAPGALDTLLELSNAINGDADFASSIAAQIAGKADAADVLNALNTKADAASVYTQAETNSLVNTAIVSLDKVDAGAISSTDSGVYQDSSRLPQADPLGIGGWHFKNVMSGQKINWYPYNAGAVVNGSPRVEELSSIWAVVNFYNTSSNFILAVYSKRTGTGDAAAWYKSRWIRSNKVNPIPASPIAGAPVRALVYWGSDPGVHPELPRVQIADTLSSNSNGNRLSSEEILTYSWGTNSASAVGAEEFTVEQVGHRMRGQLVQRSLVHVGATIAELALKANSSDVYTKAQSDAALALKANASDVYTKAETDAAVSSAVSTVLNGAPAALDTLNELAAALGNDANFAASLATQIAAKADSAEVDAALAQLSAAVASKADDASVGDTSADFVVSFEAALV